jgi:hypothetical protein
VNRGTRLAIVAGIVIAIAAGATVMAVSSPSTEPQPPAGNGNTTNNEPRQITIELNENLTLEEVE